MEKRKFRLLFIGIALAFVGFARAWGTAFYALFSLEKSLTRFKAPGTRDVHLGKGVYLFNYEFKSCLQGTHYDHPVSLINEYDICLFNDAGDQLEGKLLKGDSFTVVKTWKYSRQAISVYEFDVPQKGPYRLAVAPKTETLPEIVCTIHKKINYLAVLLVSNLFVFVIFIASILLLIWLIRFFLSCGRPKFIITKL